MLHPGGNAAQRMQQAFELDSLEVGECLRRLIAEDVLCSEAWDGLTLLYPWYLYHAETRVAQRFKQLACRARAGRSAEL